METKEMTPLDMLAQFHEKFEPPKTPEFWIGLIEEETAEAEEAFAHLLKEVCDTLYTCAGLLHVVDDEEANEIVPQELSDRIDRIFRIAQMLDFEFDDITRKAFTLVHESNLSKLGDDGQPIRRESDGKVLKGPNYKAPDLSELLAEA